MTDGLPEGLYASVGGKEYALQPMGGGTWALFSAVPDDGVWVPYGSHWIRTVTASDVDGVVSISHRGTYRGVPVQVMSTFDGRFSVTSDVIPDALEVGMSQVDSSYAAMVVAGDDPDLSFEEYRRDVAFPSPYGPRVSPRDGQLH